MKITKEEFIENTQNPSIKKWEEALFKKAKDGNIHAQQFIFANIALARNKLIENFIGKYSIEDIMAALKARYGVDAIFNELTDYGADYETVFFIQNSVCENECESIGEEGDF